ncbi:MAG: PqqD family protein [Acidimicrobiia bacterium]
MADHVVGPPHEHILAEEVSDELVLYDPVQETFVALNSTAADVWRMATGEYTVDEIVSSLASSYGMPDEAIRDQVETAVRELVEAGLLPPEET